MNDTNQPDDLADDQINKAATIGEMASIVRSKNAGPFRLTLDVFFDSQAEFERAIDSNVLSADAIVDAYGVEQGDILGIYEIDEILAIKISLVRPIPAGSPTDSDVYGAQQHSPLLDLIID